jgi:hypothetical protein
MNASFQNVVSTTVSRGQAEESTWDNVKQSDVLVSTSEAETVSLFLPGILL